MPIWVPFSMELEDVRSLSLGTTWNLIKEIGLPRLGYQFEGQKGPVKRA